MESKEFLKRLLTTTVSMDDTAVAELYNSDGQLKDDAITIVLEKDKQRIKTLKDLHTTELTNAQDIGFKRAKKELMTTFEDALKTEYGITSDKKGSELIKEIVKAKSASSDGPLTDDLVVKHTLYLQLQDKMTKALDTQKVEYETKLQQKDSEVKSKETLSFVLSEAKKNFKEANPVLPEGEPGKTQEDLFFQDFFNSYDWQLDGEGKDCRVIPIDKTTKKPLVDGHERRIEFGELVKSRTAKAFPLQVADPKNAPKPVGGGGAPAVKLYPTLKLNPPKSKDEYQKGIEAIRANTVISAEDKVKAQIEFTADFKAFETGGTAS